MGESTPMLEQVEARTGARPKDMLRTSMRTSLAAMALALLGCTSRSPELTVPEGVIVARDRPTATSDGLPTVHVQEPGDECGIVFSVHDSTTIRSGDGPATLADLTVGRRV